MILNAGLKSETYFKMKDKQLFIAKGGYINALVSPKPQSYQVYVYNNKALYLEFTLEIFCVQITKSSVNDRDWYHFRIMHLL